MDSIKKIYKIGYGPSSSHSMGVQKAAQTVFGLYPEMDKIEVILYGALAATGKGHMTDKVIEKVFQKIPHKIIWKPEETLPAHPNGMKFRIYKEGRLLEEEVFYSIGGGEISRTGKPEREDLYPHKKMREILRFCSEKGLTLWEYVFLFENRKEVEEHLRKVWSVMQDAIRRGLQAEGVLPGGLGVRRKAYEYHQKAKLAGGPFKDRLLLSSYALAVAEENAAGGFIVTAPTCGSCGVVPAVLYHMKESGIATDDSIIKALATAGLVGNLVKFNASISGAEVGCQGEIGTACAMAAAAATQLLGGTPVQIEYAAEMALEHHLGLTCDPVKGLVQIPCIERNVFAANRAIDCANFALFSDGRHLVSFDTVVEVMKETGHALPSLYKETAAAGLAKEYDKQDSYGEED